MKSLYPFSRASVAPLLNENPAHPLAAKGEIFEYLLQTSLAISHSIAWLFLKPLIEKEGRKHHFTYDDFKTEFLNKGISSEKWQQISRKLSKIATEALPFLESSGPVEWVTGTRSPMLYVIDQAVQKTMHPYALIPAGDLLRENISPLTGELALGICDNGINNTALSGVDLFNLHTAMKYAFKETPPSSSTLQCSYYTPEFLNLLKSRILYLVQVDNQGIDLSNLKKRLQEHLLSKYQNISLFSDWQKYVSLLNTTFSHTQLYCKERPLPPGYPVGILRSNGRTTWGFIIKYDASCGQYQCLINEKGQRKYQSFYKLCVPKLKKNDQPLSKASPEKIAQIEGFLNPRKRVEDTLALFDTLKPYSAILLFIKKSQIPILSFGV